MEKILLIGLGNIGEEYVHTRHNIGFDIADAFVRRHDAGWHIDRLAEVAQFKIKGRQVTVIKPSTYMNLSGESLACLLKKDTRSIQKLIVISDDLALPLGKIRLRTKGSDGGHCRVVVSNNFEKDGTVGCAQASSNAAVVRDESVGSFTGEETVWLLRPCRTRQ